MAQQWALSDIGDLSGKLAVITGGNSGLGTKTGLELARRGAEVLLACRSPNNGEAAVAAIKSIVPNAKVSHAPLDLIDHASIDAFAETIMSKHARLDILLHNSGLVMHPDYDLTPTGRELQMQVNHLGHFALTGRLLPLITKTPNARVVQSNTVTYYSGKIDFNDFDWAQRKYNGMQAYFDSRLAQILFAYHLNQQFKNINCDAKLISMQPGLVRTEGLENTTIGGASIMRLLSQSLESGCRTHLRACTDPTLKTFHFLEPKYIIGGRPTPKPFKAAACDADIARLLVAHSENVTGVTLNLGTH